MTKYFSEILFAWYNDHERALPWRQTRNPYFIWISEIILQQTRVEQGLPYYQRFVTTFPDVHSLAGASEDAVLKTWQGLGYYSRARNMHKTARLIADKYNGYFPKTLQGLLELPGIGPYTAAAIASFAFDVPEPVVDGNVQRVISRFFAIDVPVSSAAGKKAIEIALQSVFDTQQPARFNQAIMEFGALQCVPNNPECPACPLRWKCLAFEQKKVHELPAKKRRTKVSTRYLNYFIPVRNGNTVLEKRVNDGIWKNLYQFPLFESTDRNEWTNGSEGLDIALSVPSKDLPALKIVSEEKRLHLLSHQRLHIRLVVIAHQKPLPLDTNRFIATPLNRILSNFAVPGIIEKFVRDAGW